MSLEGIQHRVDRAPLPPRPAYIRINRETGHREPVFKSRQGVGEEPRQMPLQTNGGLEAEVIAPAPGPERFHKPVEEITVFSGFDAAPEH